MRTLDAADVARAHEAAARADARLDLTARSAEFAPHRAVRELPRGVPTLHLEDVSQIPFVSVIPGVERYQHRARVRAHQGDLVAATVAPDPDYEAYCVETLGWAPVELVLAEPVGSPLAIARACGVGRAFSRIVEVARARGGLAIHPYMAIEDVWTLAACVARAADVDVWVVGPTPPVLWLANDKEHLTALVHDALGPSFSAETMVASEPGAIADALAAMLRRHPRVGLKRTRCASAMGNQVFQRAQLSPDEPDAIRAATTTFLREKEWTSGEPVLIVAWVDVCASPSTQLWIPHPDDGPPRLDGIYEQLLLEDAGVFLGSRPSRLPKEVHDDLAKASTIVAIAFQQLGYRGRCSFDFVVTGDVRGQFQVLFVECNGRWGGTSTPMHLVDRVFGAPRPVYRAQDWAHETLRGTPFKEILRRVGEEVYHPTHGRGRYLFYNVGPLADKGKLDVIAVGDSPEEVDRRIDVDFGALLGVG